MEKKFVIIDNGSGFVKAGFSGEFEPKVISPTVVGYPKDRSSNENENNSKILFGQEALDKKEEVDIIRPIKQGIVTDLDSMTLYWDNLFKNELKIDPSEHGVLLIERLLTPVKIREKIINLFFEHFNVPSLYINNSATFTLYGIRKFSGIVVDSGYDYTMFTPLRNGYPFISPIQTLDIGGKDIDDYLQTLLNEKGYKNIPNITEIKEKYSYISKNPDEENTNEEELELPDKTKIKIKDEKFLSTELFYHPEYIGKELGGIARKLFNTIYDTDHYLKKELQGPIVLAGGNTLFKGFEDRFSYESKIEAIGLFKDRIKVYAPAERRYVQWVGGSIFSLTNVFPNLCTNKAEFEECGASPVHNKTFYTKKTYPIV